MDNDSPALMPSTVPLCPGMVAVWRASGLWIEVMPVATEGPIYRVTHRLRISRDLVQTACSAQEFMHEVPPSEFRKRRQVLREVLVGARPHCLDPFSEFEERVIVAATMGQN